MASSKAVNIAILGCGNIAQRHSKLLRKRGDVRLYFASRDSARAHDFNTRFSGHGAFDSYEAAIESQEIDAVFICTPPINHFELAERTLQAEKHLIVEKPPFVKVEDARKIATLASNQKRQVMVAENYFYKPLLGKLRELIESGVIGDILFLHLNALKQQEVTDWRGDTSIAGGGALIEGGIHWVNFFSNLGLTLKDARGLRPGSQEGIEMSVHVVLEYAEGAAGSFYYSWEVPSLFKGLRISKIYGRAGSITFESNGLFIIVRGKEKRVIFPGFKDITGQKAMLNDFVEALKNDTPPRFNFELAQRDLRVVERIYRTISNQQTEGINF